MIIDSSAATTVIYPAPSGAPISKQYSVTINGAQCPAYKSLCDQVNYTSFDVSGGPVAVTVTATEPGYWSDGVNIRPLSRGVVPKVEGQKLTFTIDKPCQLSVERPSVSGSDQDAEVLFVFANPPENDAPKADDPDVIYYGPGMHRVEGNIALRSGQTLYIAGGAIVDAGGVRARNAKDIAIRGRGTLCCRVEKIWDSGIQFDNCRSILLEDVTVFTYVPDGNQYGIQNHLSKCSDVTVCNYKAIGSNANTDGFQCHGCSKMTFTDSFIRGTDDNLAFYGNSFDEQPGESRTSDISVKGCVFWPMWQSGVCRIGWGDYPNPTNASNIEVRDCDVIHMWQGDMPEHALLDMREFAGRDSSISNILFEDIRVEECDSLITVYTDESKGFKLRNLLMRNIDVKQPIWRTSFRGRPGKTFFGCNDFENVTFENITVAGKQILSPEQMGMSLYGVAATQPEKLRFLDANGENHCPTAVITTDATAGAAPLKVRFDASKSSSPDGKIASYTWDFGDGTAGHGATVSHTYKKNGQYEVILSVVSDSGVPRTTRLNHVTVADRGLTAEYFLTRNLTDRAIVTVDRGLDLNWGKIPPRLEVGETEYSVRWSGQIIPRYSELYTFTLDAGDGARLWVDGRLLVDGWNAAGKGQGKIDLKANRHYDIKLEYRENGGTGYVRVKWASASQAEVAVPARCLVPWTSDGPAGKSANYELAEEQEFTARGFLTKLYTAEGPQSAKSESWTRMKQSGYEFVPARDITITALGRALGGDWKSSHVIRIWRVSDKTEVASVPVWISSKIDGIGVRYEKLPSPVVLQKGESYRITSTEYAGVDDTYIVGDLQSTDAAMITHAIRMTGYDGFPDVIDLDGEKGSGPPTFYYH